VPAERLERQLQRGLQGMPADWQSQIRGISGFENQAIASRVT
jgi:hypothetical protein